MCEEKMKYKMKQNQLHWNTFFMDTYISKNYWNLEWIDIIIGKY